MLLIAIKNASQVNTLQKKLKDIKSSTRVKIKV